MMEEGDICFAIDTQPNDHAFLVRYVDENTVNQQIEREATYLSNYLSVPDLNHQVALVHYRSCEEFQDDDAILFRSTPVVNEASDLVQNGCCLEVQDSAALLRSTPVVNEASLVQYRSCEEVQDDAAILFRSTQVVHGSSDLVQNGCYLEVQDSAALLRSTPVVNEASLVQYRSCEEVQDDAALLFRPTQVVNEASDLVQYRSCEEVQDDAAILLRSTEVVNGASLVQNGCCVEAQDDAKLLRSTQVVNEASQVQNGFCVEAQDNAALLRSTQVVHEAADLAQNGCCAEVQDNATLLRSAQVVHEASDLVQNGSCVESEDGAASSRSIEVVKEAAALEVEYAPLLLRSAEVAEGDEEANASEPIEPDREQFCQNPNTRKENPETSRRRENLRESVDPLKRKAITADVVEGDHGIIKRAFVRIDNRQLCRSLIMRPVNDRPAIKHNKVQVLVPIYNEANQMTKKKKHDHQNQDLGVESSQKHDVKEEPNPNITTHQCTECSATVKMIGGRHLEEGDEGSEMSDSVEILDIAPLVENGLVSPFVSSKKFHTTMADEEGRGPTASDVFRADVLRIFRKPFDKEEYTELREAIKAGNYLDHHQDVKRKLKTFRHKRGKCLNILRGFFYWLQNLTREGSFQPWTDRQCLAVEPPRS